MKIKLSIYLLGLFYFFAPDGEAKTDYDSCLKNALRDKNACVKEKCLNKAPCSLEPESSCLGDYEVQKEECRISYNVPGEALEGNQIAVSNGREALAKSKTGPVVHRPKVNFH